MSSTATQVKEESTGSGKSLGSYRRILLGYDGSENAKRALERAIALAIAQQATLRIVVVAHTIPPAYGTTAPYDSMTAPNYLPDYAEEVIKQGEKLLADALNRAKEGGAQISGFVKEGYTADVILDAAESDGVDLIVVGRRGISAVERFLMGSVSSSVISHSKCDVLVVK